MSKDNVGTRATVAAAIVARVWTKADGWLEAICGEHGLCPDEHDWELGVWPVGGAPVEEDETIAAVEREMGQLLWGDEEALGAVDAACDKAGVDPSSVEISFVVSCVVR